jgi:hypothetical protein
MRSRGYTVSGSGMPASSSSLRAGRCLARSQAGGSTAWTALGTETISGQPRHGAITDHDPYGVARPHFIAYLLFAGFVMWLPSMFFKCIAPGIAALFVLVFLWSSARAQDEPFDPPLYHIVNAERDDLALRTEPSFQRGLGIALVPNGTLLEVVERRKDRWWYVRLLPFGQEGWVLSGRGSRRWIECCRVGGNIPLPDAIEESVGFKTPTKNVYCVLEENWLRCDAKPNIGPLSPKPPNCYLDWGDAFLIAPDSEGGYVLCHGDTVENDALPTLSYGSSWIRNGYTCTSDRTAVTCTNEGSHGFRLSRMSRAVF